MRYLYVILAVMMVALLGGCSVQKETAGEAFRPAQQCACWEKSGENIYYNEGAVGIGQKFPEYDLQIQDTNEVSSGIGEGAVVSILGRPDGWASLFLGDIGNAKEGGVLYNNEDDRLQFRAGGKDVMVIDTDGQVGIGTPYPHSNLEIYGSMGRAILTLNAPIAGIDFWRDRANDQVPMGKIIVGRTASGSSSPSMSFQVGNSIRAILDENTFGVVPNVKLDKLKGQGNAYVCVDSEGQLFRSSEPCR